MAQPIEVIEHGVRRVPFVVDWPAVAKRVYGPGVERWRRLIGHDGYLLADLRVATPAEGGRRRAVQGGYHAQWWLVSGGDEVWVGSGPLDLLDEQRSIKPGHNGQVAIHPMDPSAWQDVDSGSVLHMRERVGQTLGVANVTTRVGVPDAAALRLDAVSVRSGEKRLGRTDGIFKWVLRVLRRDTRRRRRRWRCKPGDVAPAVRHGQHLASRAEYGDGVDRQAKATRRMVRTPEPGILWCHRDHYLGRRTSHSSPRSMWWRSVG